jgi:hypothetical protein
MCRCTCGGDDAQEGPTEVSDQDFLYALGILRSEDRSHVFMVPCPYMGLDWRRCPNILFTPDDRVNISVFLN